MLFAAVLVLCGNALNRHAVDGLNPLAHRAIQHIFANASSEAAMGD